MISLQVKHKLLLLSFALFAFSATGLAATEFITTAKCTNLLGLVLTNVMVGDPFLLVTACSSRSNISNGGADCRGAFDLLGLRSEGNVGKVSSAAEDGENHDVGGDPAAYEQYIWNRRE